MNATNPEPPFDEQALIAVVAKVWRTYLKLNTVDMMPSGARELPPTAVTAAVAVNGAWDGHLRIVAPLEAAAEIASLMMASDRRNVTEKDMSDALGELANILGGNLHGLLPLPNQLGLPVVTVGGRGAMRFPASRPTLTVTVSWNGAPIEFCLLEAVPRRDRVGASH